MHWIPHSTGPAAVLITVEGPRESFYPEVAFNGPVESMRPVYWHTFPTASHNQSRPTYCFTPVWYAISASWLLA